MIVTYDVILLSLLLLSSTAAGQPTATPPPPAVDHTPATVFVFLLFVFFMIGFFGFFSLCTSSASPSSSLLRGRQTPIGLDAAALAAFPVFLYSEVKELKIGKNALECAICLNEFDDDDTLRLIPVCDHVFHPDCIDAWLDAHVTCPVCRANLVEKVITDASENTTLTSVRVVTQEEEVDPYAHTLNQSLGSSTRFSAHDSSVGRRTRFFGPPAQASGFFFGKFPRSHSTGHSLVRPGENTERFTLRFPENVRKEVMTRALVRTATFNNVKEGSSRRGRSFKKMDRAVKSDRWVINIPFFSNKGTDGEGSARGRVAVVKLPSFKCLEPSVSGDVGPVLPEV